MKTEKLDVPAMSTPNTKTRMKKSTRSARSIDCSPDLDRLKAARMVCSRGGDVKEPEYAARLKQSVMRKKRAKGKRQVGVPARDKRRTRRRGRVWEDGEGERDDSRRDQRQNEELFARVSGVSPKSLEPLTLPFTVKKKGATICPMAVPNGSATSIVIQSGLGSNRV